MSPETKRRIARVAKPSVWIIVGAGLAWILFDKIRQGIAGDWGELLALVIIFPLAVLMFGVADWAAQPTSSKSKLERLKTQRANINRQIKKLEAEDDGHRP